MKNKKARVIKIILIVLGAVVLLALAHLTANNLIPWIQQLHGR